MQKILRYFSLNIPLFEENQYICGEFFRLVNKFLDIN